MIALLPSQNAHIPDALRKMIDHPYRHIAHDSLGHYISQQTVGSPRRRRSSVGAVDRVPQARHGEVQEQEDKSDCDCFDEAQSEWACQHQERQERFG